jgi:hypothetical protein
MRRLTLRACEVRPQVIVFEDLHWMDQATEEYLCFVADSIPTSRLLLLLTYRPGYLHPLGERTYHTRVALRPPSGGVYTPRPGGRNSPCRPIKRRARSSIPSRPG